MEPQEIDSALDELENRLDRLRSLYEQYFMGIEKIEPTVPRKDVDRRFWILRRTQVRNTARRFRLQTLVQRYNTFQQHWTRICREIENGTYVRHLLKARKNLGAEPKTWAAKKRLGLLRRDRTDSTAPPAEEAGAGEGAAAHAGNGHAEHPADVGATRATPSFVPGPPSSIPRRREELKPLDLDFDDAPTLPPAIRRSVPPAAARADASVVVPLPDTAQNPAATRTPVKPPLPARPSAKGAAQPTVPSSTLAESAAVSPPKPAAVSLPKPAAAAATALPRPAPTAGVALPRPAATSTAPRPGTPSTASALPRPALPRPATAAPNPAVTLPRPAAAGSTAPKPPAAATALPKPAPAATLPKPSAAPAATLPKPSATPATTLPKPYAASATTLPKPSATPAATITAAQRPAPAATIAAAQRPGAPPTPPAAPRAASPVAAQRPVPTAAASPPRAAAPTAPKTSGAALSDERVAQLHAELNAARRQLNQSSSLSIDSLAKSLRETESKLKGQHGGRSVDFQVVIKDGKPIVKPVVRR